MSTSEDQIRGRLVATALEWESRFGVAPQITSAIAEYDAAQLVGHSDESYAADCVGRTAVTRGADFSCRGIRYQVKANRPSGKPGSPVTKVGKASNYEWDRLIWLLYDRFYVLQEGLGVGCCRASGGVPCSSAYSSTGHAVRPAHLSFVGDLRGCKRIGHAGRLGPFAGTAPIRFN